MAASLVKLVDVAAATLPRSAERAGAFYLKSQSCSLQGIITSSSSSSWRPTQRNSAATLSSANPPTSPHGDHLLKAGTKPQPFRAMALPIRRKTLEGAGDSAAAQEGELEEPWLGAVVFKRSIHPDHYEFNTSLERLGLGKLSTESSRELAESMGLSSGFAPDTEEGTPVNISIDVTREDDSWDLQLDGITRTTISLCCNRCLSPVVERVFASFNLLLTEKPVTEPTQQRLGVVLGGNGPKHEGPELDLDLDDKIHFPREAKEIDISKYLRDSVHLEIPYKSMCSIQCAGLCLTCGVNLNERVCDCKDVCAKPSWGPLEQLRAQLKDGEGLQ